MAIDKLFTKKLNISTGKIYKYILYDFITLIGILLVSLE